jgi:NAD-specific glutamate dehydrogenase
MNKPELGDLGLAQEFLAAMFDQTSVKVLTTEMSITTGGQHLVHTFLDLKQRHIERSSTQIEDQHMSVRLGIQTVSVVCV